MGAGGTRRGAPGFVRNSFFAGETFIVGRSACADAGDGTMFETRPGAFPKPHHSAMSDGNTLGGDGFPVAWQRC